MRVPLEAQACLKVEQETVSLLEPPSHTMEPNHLPAVAPTTPLPNPLARLEKPRTLIALGTSVLAWLVLFALSWCLLSQSALIWLLGQTVLPGRLAVWLAQFGLFALGQVLPPALTLALCRQQGAKGVLPLVLLTVALVPFALTFGRIDTQGTIWQNFDRAVQQGNMQQARGLLLILMRRYAAYGYFTDGAALIRAGVDPNVQDSQGITPLMSVLDNPTYVQQLVQQGADLQLKDGYGKTAMDDARTDAKAPQTIQILQQAQQRQQTQ